MAGDLHVGRFEAVIERAADLVVRILSAAISREGAATFVPSAGRTCTPIYRLLATRYADALEWNRVHILQMDEYADVAASDLRSFAFYLRRELIAPLAIEKFTSFVDEAGGLALPFSYLDSFSTRIDLALHGIGRNGHIGFNEPGSSRYSPSRRVRLERSTSESNFESSEDRARFCEGWTLGLSTLLSARHSILVATGRTKADALAAMYEEEAASNCPAAMLLSSQTNLSVFADDAAASLLKRETLVRRVINGRAGCGLAVGRSFNDRNGGGAWSSGVRPLLQIGRRRPSYGDMESRGRIELPYPVLQTDR